MLKYFIIGCAIALIWNLARSVSPKDCDGDCYNCPYYGYECEGNEADYDFFEEEDQ